MSQSDRDHGAMDRHSYERDTHKKHLKHHRNLNDAVARGDFEEDDFFYETKEKFHRGR